MSYRVNREKTLSDDAENNTAVASAGSEREVCVMVKRDGSHTSH